MTQSELLIKLANVKDELYQRFGIEKIALFGSYARGEETQESDVDIVVLEMNLKSGFDIINAKNYLQNYLQRPVDIGTFKSMKTFIKNRIKKDFIYV